MTKKNILLIFTILLSLSVFAESGIYVGGHFRRERTVTVPTLKASGFTYVILFNVQVEPSGDLTTDGDTICSNGVYVFNKKHPYYTSDVAALKTGTTSIKRIETCIGGWGSKSYANIKALVTAQGTGPTSILYKNFEAFKKALPDIEAVNDDDEATYDVTTTTNFHVMLYDLGFKTTLAPYMNKSFWQSAATNINAKRPGAVDRIYIQCYDGGAGNNPADWNLNNITLHAGVLNFDATSTVTSKMINWKKTSTTVGGFVWVYNDNSYSLKAYATAINNVFDHNPYMTAYPECDYKGTGVEFEKGSFNVSAITSKGFMDKSLSSFKLAPGFKMQVYKKDNYSGAVTTLEESVPCLESMNLNDSIRSWIVRPNGDVSFSAKTLYLRNRKSGMYLSVTNESTSSSMAAVQRSYTGKNDQKWTFTVEPYGVYRLVNLNSKKTLQVRQSSLLEGGKLDQYTDSGADNQKFIIQKSGNGNYYKVIPLQSTRFLKIDAAQSNTENASVIQGGLATDPETDWELLTEEVVLSSPTVSITDDVRIYPNPVKDFLNVDKGDKTIEKMEVLDLQGRSLLVQNGSGERINTNFLVPGMYILSVQMREMPRPFVTKFTKK